MRLNVKFTPTLPVLILVMVKILLYHCALMMSEYWKAKVLCATDSGHCGHSYKYCKL